MTRGQRIFVLAFAAVCLAASVVALVREIALAASPGLVWKVPSWWADLPHERGWHSALGGAIALALAAVCFRLVGRVRAGGGAEAAEVHLAKAAGAHDGGAAEVAVRRAALEAVVRRAVLEAAPALHDPRVSLTSANDGFCVRISGVAAPVTLADLHARAFAAADGELRVATGISLKRLDIVVDAFLPQTGGE